MDLSDRRVFEVILSSDGPIDFNTTAFRGMIIYGLEAFNYMGFAGEHVTVQIVECAVSREEALGPFIVESPPNGE
jgi:hypothetical protein